MQTINIVLKEQRTSIYQIVRELGKFYIKT